MTYKSTGDFGIYAVGGDIRLTGSAGSQVAKLRMDGTTFYVSGAGEVFHQSASGVIILPPYGTSAGETTKLGFRELAANGTAKGKYKGSRRSNKRSGSYFTPSPRYS